MAAPDELNTLFVRSLNARFTEKLRDVKLFTVYCFCIALFKFEISIFEFEKLKFVKYYYIGSIFKY